ncbi:MAG: CHAT domain-containing protein, partial [Thauera sp.]|nr:CHAT domain-containing protein [Thauera sp.]
ASLARELIDMGVRCVVAAGWEVRDDAALSFSETFFTHMTVHGAHFADAIFLARRAALDAHPDCNTWGAYQAYGDPAFQLRLNAGATRDEAPLLAAEELLDWLEQLRLDTRLPGASKAERDFDALNKRIRRRLGRLPPNWAERTDVLQALGRLYAEYGAAGFDAARLALLRAIAEDSSQGLVPISAIEQLINMEARQAERLSVPGTGQDLAAATVLIDDALARVQALSTLSGLHPAVNAAPIDALRADALRPNTERQSIIGSAWKRKALILLRSPEPEKDAVREALLRARDAYARGEADARATDWNPYARINRLQLDAVLGETPAGEVDASACAAAARARFEQRFEFWDAVMAADATLAGWLGGAELPEGRGAVEVLSQAYRDTLETVAASPRELDSAFAQIGLLADFLLLQGGKEQLAQAKVLKEVIAVLQAPAE